MWIFIDFIIWNAHIALQRTLRLRLRKVQKINHVIFLRSRDLLLTVNNTSFLHGVFVPYVNNTFLHAFGVSSPTLALFHAYISYLIMWCDCYMSQSRISHHVTGYALFHLFFHHCITFWWLAQPVTAFWWLTQPVITFWWLVQPVLVLHCLTDVCIYTCWCNSFVTTITYTSLNAS